MVRKLSCIHKLFTNFIPTAFGSKDIIYPMVPHLVKFSSNKLYGRSTGINVQVTGQKSRHLGIVQECNQCFRLFLLSSGMVEVSGNHSNDVARSNATSAITAPRWSEEPAGRGSCIVREAIIGYLLKMALP